MLVLEIDTALQQENRLTRRFRWLAVAAGSIAAVMAGAVSVRAQDDITETCVDVRIGNDRAAYLNCLNDELKRSVERQRKVAQPTAPVDARSPSNQTGVYNDAAAREHMGNAFGVSSRPQRPAAPVFVSPLTSH